MPLPTPLAEAADVLAILEEDHVPEGLDLDPFIQAAVMALYGRGAYTKYNVSTEADQLKILETWLGAHFTCIAYALLVEERIGDQRSVERVERKIDMGLDQTPYGQMVKVLDSKGMFRKRLIVTWLGTIPAGVGEAP